MGLFDVFKKAELPARDDKDIVAVCNGEMIAPGKISDPMFAEEMMGQTIGFVPADGDFVSPANGELEMIATTGHAFSIRMADGTGLLIHIGIDTVAMKGNGFKLLKKQGDKVKAGEKIIKADLKAIKAAGHESTTMLIVAEPAEEDAVLSFRDFGPVTQGEVISR